MPNIHRVYVQGTVIYLVVASSALVAIKRNYERVALGAVHYADNK